MRRAVSLRHWLSALLCAAPLLSHAVNLGAEAGVVYRYRDAAGHEIAADQFNDPERVRLTDGLVTNAETVTSAYRGADEKNLRVCFEFPTPVSVDAVELVWMWAHNPQQWFDLATVSAGNAPDQLREVATLRNPGGSQNAEYFTIPVPAGVTARCWQLTVTQHAAIDRFMFGIAEVVLTGDAAQQARIAAAASHRLTPELTRHYPANVFAADAPVEVEFNIGGAAPDETAAITYALRDYFGHLVEQDRLSVAATAANRLRFDQLPAGYYTLELTAAVTGDDGAQRTGTTSASLVVAPLTERSAAEALAAGARFGIQGGYQTPETLDAFARLGMPWLRGLLFFAPFAGDDPAHPDWSTLQENVQRSILDRPMIGFWEIKTIPSYCYDAARFGAKDDNWSLRMPSDKATYQAFIAAQIRQLPPDQKYFELWNEPWDLYSPEEFATLAQWMLEAIKTERPDALVGPNLGPMAHLDQVIAHGGMDGMDFLSIHPYSEDFRSSPERAGLRERLRSYRKLLRERLGRDLPLYVTEIGWPTPVGGPIVNTEAEQARFMARAALILYAEGIEAIMPYCAGQPETDPNEKEHFFGFVRRDLTPKPVLAAYATVARQLENSRYIGDLWLGVDIGAMLFERNGERILALYTDGAPQSVFLRPDADAVTVTDLTGGSERIAIRENRLTLTVSGDPVYVTGLGPGVEQLLAAGDETRWSNVYQRAERSAPRIADPFAPGAWDGVPEWTCRDERIDPAHLNLRWQAGWNDDALLLRWQITDVEPGVNPNDGLEIWRGDCVEVFVSTAPENAVPGFLKEPDHQLLLSPFSQSQRPVAVFGDTYRRGREVAVRAEYATQPDGWSAVVAIPFAALNFDPARSRLLGLELAVDDLDRDHARIQLNSNGRQDNWANSAVWSLLRLAE